MALGEDSSRTVYLALLKVNYEFQIQSNCKTEKKLLDFSSSEES